MNKYLAYLIGAYLGDGHCYVSKDPNRSNYQFILATEDYDFCEICSKICLNYFKNGGNIKPIYRKNKLSYYKLVICNGNLVQYLIEKTDTKKVLPNFKDWELNRSLIQGLMDADGWISRCPVQNNKYFKYSIGFKNTALWTPQFYNLMKNYVDVSDLNYNNQVYRYKKRTKPYYNFRITVKDYIENIGFRIKRKKDLCHLYLKEIKQPITFSEEELFDLYIKKNYSRKQLSDYYKCSESNIKKQLKK